MYMLFNRYTRKIIIFPYSLLIQKHMNNVHTKYELRSTTAYDQNNNRQF